MAATRWGIEHDGRRIEVEPEGRWSGNVLRLFADGEQLGEVKKGERKLTVEADGIAVRAWFSWLGAIQRAELAPADGGAPLPLAPAPGSRAARREAWAREHPGLYSARHAAKGVGEVLIGLVGLAFLLRLLPDISIDLPSVDLPSIDLPLPSIDVPEVQLLPTMPGWVRAIGETTKYWVPVLIGVGVALREYDRRRRQAERAGSDGRGARRAVPDERPASREASAAGAGSGGGARSAADAGDVRRAGRR